MARTSGIFALAAVTLLLVGCASLQPPPMAQCGFQDAQGRPQVGYLEHRGRRHDVRDLLDPACRAASDDDFVQSFDPKSALADPRHEPARLRSLSADLIGHMDRE